MDAFQRGGWPDVLLADSETLAYMAREFPIAELPDRIRRAAVYVAYQSSPVDPAPVDRPGVRVIHAPVLSDEAEEVFRCLAGAPTASARPPG